MGLNNTEEPKVSAAQAVYARWLDIGTRIGFASLILSFSLYLLRFVDPWVPLAELPRYWTLPVDRYLAATGIPSGWGWVSLVLKGDILNFVGIAVLALVTVACFARVSLVFMSSRDFKFTALAVIQIVVLALAAIGIAGH